MYICIYALCITYYLGRKIFRGAQENTNQPCKQLNVRLLLTPLPKIQCWSPTIRSAHLFRGVKFRPASNPPAGPTKCWSPRNTQLWIRGKGGETCEASSFRGGWTFQMNVAANWTMSCFVTSSDARRGDKDQNDHICAVAYCKPCKPCANRL